MYLFIPYNKRSITVVSFNPCIIGTKAYREFIFITISFDIITYNQLILIIFFLYSIKKARFCRSPGGGRIMHGICLKLHINPIYECAGFKLLQMTSLTFLYGSISINLPLWRLTPATSINMYYVLFFSTIPITIVCFCNFFNVK